MPKSGFCSIGHHEGGRYPGPSGKLNKTCTMIETCTCDDPTCHSFFNKMFEQAEMARMPVDNSGYQPDPSTWIMPEPIIVEAAPILSNSGDKLAPGTLESVAPGVAPPVARASFAPTQSGRAARGQLEDQVNQVCITWSIEQEPALCTPQFISDEIARKEGIKNPSTGAIAAVFDRWTKIGYALVERKPTRFLRFTDDGVKYGLDYLKQKAKRK